MNGDAGPAAAVAQLPPLALAMAGDEDGGPGEEAGGRGGGGDGNDAAAAAATTTTPAPSSSAQQQQQQQELQPIVSPSGVRIPRTVEDIYADHDRRRSAILRALTKGKIKKKTFFFWIVLIV